ncbi:MAG TPA: SCO family protein [Thermoanaerobaculia bacterium]|nr:SCO family protein [Thermoanaerobaculia bacterium]
MSPRRHRAFASALAFALALGGLAASAEEAMPCHGTAAPAAAAPASPHGPEVSLSEVTLPALTLTDQQGRAVDVRSLLSGRWVALNFVFTRCTTICPPMGANFGKLAKELGDRLGQEVELVSISIDPAIDTPERLRAWREKFWPGEGWTLLTGPKPQIDRLLRAFGVPVGDPSAHAPILFIGRGDGASWQRLYGMTPPAEVVGALDRLAQQLSSEQEVAP